MDFDMLAGLRGYLSVKHHIPGRIRVKFDPAIIRDKEAMRLAKSKRGLPPGVTNARLNVLARSAVIEYDPGRIDPDLLEELASTKDADRAAEIAETLWNTLNLDNA